MTKISTLRMEDKFLKNLPISSEFNLGSFLRNEKTEQIGSSLESHISLRNRVNFADVYIKHQYWNLNFEYLINCFITICWSVWGLILIKNFLIPRCVASNETILTLSAVWFTLNLIENLSLIALLYAKRSVLWIKKLYILQSSIGIKIFLTIFHFIWLIACTFHTPCGYRFPEIFHSRNLVNNGLIFSFIRWILFYDIKMLGLAHACISIAYFNNAMLLAVKNNDLKMYALWRMGQLDKFIQDLQSM